MGSSAEEAGVREQLHAGFTEVETEAQASRLLRLTGPWVASSRPGGCGTLKDSALGSYMAPGVGKKSFGGTGVREQCVAAELMPPFSESRSRSLNGGR